MQASSSFQDGPAVLLPLGKVSKCNLNKAKLFVLLCIHPMPNLDIPPHPPLQKGTSPTPKSIERITGIPEFSRGRNNLQGACSTYITAGTLKGALRSLSLPALLQSLHRKSPASQASCSNLLATSYIKFKFIFLMSLSTYL